MPAWFHALRKSSARNFLSVMRGRLFPAGLLCVASLLGQQAVGDAYPQATLERVELQPQGTPARVTVVGRAERSGNGMYRYQWPGTYFLTSFRGSDLFFTVGTGNQNLHVTLDGAALPALVRPASGVYRMRASAGTHHVRIEAVNENQDGPKTLGAFVLTHGEIPLKPTSRPRQLEFIGDSHTVGYGNTSATRECTSDQVWLTTDTSQSIAANTARHYGADFQIHAISGRGVVRNYNGILADTVPTAYPFLLLDKQARASEPAWRPGVIVVSLGTNDFSTALHPGEPWPTREALHTAFKQSYVNFVQLLRKQHPRARILLWATDMAQGEIAAEGTKVVEQLRAGGDPNVEFLEMTGLSFAGCHSHPSTADDLAISQRLIQAIDAHPVRWQ